MTTKYYNLWNLEFNRWTNATCWIGDQYFVQDECNPHSLTLEQAKTGFRKLLLSNGKLPRGFEVRELFVKGKMSLAEIAVARLDAKRRQEHAMKHF